VLLSDTRIFSKTNFTEDLYLNVIFISFAFSTFAKIYIGTHNNLIHSTVNVM